jgi:WhiB family redox-sensing transcriptional regulator
MDGGNTVNHTTTTPAASDWRHGAACLHEDPELFFPIGNTDPALQWADEAKAVCNRCPVMQDCLAWALETRQEHGVWGGMSEGERRSELRRAARRLSDRKARERQDAVS